MVGCPVLMQVAAMLLGMEAAGAPAAAGGGPGVAPHPFPPHCVLPGTAPRPGWETPKR